jgi:hypothetical protein
MRSVCKPAVNGISCEAVLKSHQDSSSVDRVGRRPESGASPLFGALFEASGVTHAVFCEERQSAVQSLLLGYKPATASLEEN